jgi:hypothetical protein
VLGVNETDRRHSATNYLKKSDKRQPLISKLRFVLWVKSTATFIAIKQAGLGYTLGGSRKFPFIPLQFVRYSGSETYTQISLGIIIIEYKIAHLVSGAAKGGGGGGGGVGSVRLSAVLRISCGISYTHLLSAHITY